MFVPTKRNNTALSSLKDWKYKFRTAVEFGPT